MTDVCMQTEEDEMISNSHKKVRMKSAERTECRKEGVEPCVGGLIETWGLVIKIWDYNELRAYTPCIIQGCMFVG